MASPENDDGGMERIANAAWRAALFLYAVMAIVLSYYAWFLWGWKVLLEAYATVAAMGVVVRLIGIVVFRLSGRH